MNTFTDPLVLEFEASTIDPSRFHHREHLYVAWCYLRRLPVEEAFERYVHHLRALAIALGVPQKFDAEITRTYIARLGEAMLRSPGADFDALLAAQPQLMR